MNLYISGQGKETQAAKCCFVVFLPSCTAYWRLIDSEISRIILATTQQSVTQAFIARKALSFRTFMTRMEHANAKKAVFTEKRAEPSEKIPLKPSSPLRGILKFRSHISHRYACQKAPRLNLLLCQGMMLL
jgi:hypothetical protein